MSDLKFSPYSFSKINLFGTCPKKFDYNYIQKLGVWVPNLATERGSFIHSMLENETKKKPTSFKFTLITEEIEQECIEIFEKFKDSFLGRLYLIDVAQAEVSFGVKIVDGEFVPCSYYDKEALFRGKIDHLIEHKGGIKLSMIDWKSGKVSSFPAPLQLVMYSVWGFLKYPEVNDISTSFVYVEHENQQKEYKFKREHLPALKKKVIEKISEIEKAEKYPMKESKLCEYCEYRKSGICVESSQDDFQILMDDMVPSYKAKKRELFYYSHPESGSAWIQDYRTEYDDGLTEEIDSEIFYSLEDLGYDRSDIDYTVQTKDNS